MLRTVIRVDIVVTILVVMFEPRWENQSKFTEYHFIYLRLTRPRSRLRCQLFGRKFLAFAPAYHYFSLRTMSLVHISK